MEQTMKKLTSGSKLAPSVKKKLVFLIALILLAVVCIVAIMWGKYTIGVPRIFATLLGNGTRAENMAIMQIRLPRICIALLVSIALSTSGSVLQTVSKNPLAEPGMIGINAGAALAVVLLITSRKSAYYNTLSMDTKLLIPLAAVAGAMLSAALIYGLAFKKGIAPVRLILVGIGINAGINAIISFYQLKSSKGDYNQVLTWTSGSLWGSSWDYVAILTPILFVLLLLVIRKNKTLDVMQLGDEVATGLGVHVQKESAFFFFIAALLAALATAVAGNIAFLGLLGPQLAKRLVGTKHKWQIPVGACISAVILILADAISRNLFSPIEIPVGITVSVLGVPYFIYLMMKEK